MAKFIDMLLPAPCAICGRPPSVLCLTCRDSLELSVRTVARGTLRGLAATEYSAAVSAMFSSVKERGQTAVWTRLDSGFAALGGAVRDTWPNAALLCMPSSKAAMARRGFNPALQLCKLVARAAGLPVIGGLSYRRQPDDQAALGQQARAANLRDSMSFVAPRPLERELILFDDVVTTGATLLEAQRAVLAAGAGLRVSGFCVFAETLKKVQPTG